MFKSDALQRYNVVETNIYVCLVHMTLDIFDMDFKILLSHQHTYITHTHVAHIGDSNTLKLVPS